MAYFFRSRSSGVQQNPTPSLQVGRRDAAALDMPPTSEEEPLVYPGHELPVSPKLWLVLGLLYGILGIVQLILAFTWRWWFGVALGLGVIKTGSSLTGLGWTGGRQVRPDAATLGAQLKRALLRVLLWGSAKIQQLLWRLRWLVYGYGVFIALLIAIHLASPDPQPPPAAFPAECPHAKRFGCSRVAEAAIHGARGQQPAYIESGPDFVQDAAEAWVAAQTHARVLQSQLGFFHARFVSFLWGFADDFYASFRCHNATHAIVEAQGELRIGKSDLGVNRRRNARFLAYLLQAAAEGSIPEGRCDAGPAAGGQQGAGPGGARR